MIKIIHTKSNNKYIINNDLKHNLQIEIRDENGDTLCKYEGEKISAIITSSWSI